MSDEDERKRTALSTYPTSRLAPPFRLVDIAREIEAAQQMVGASTEAGLVEIAEQIRHLQSRARLLMESAHRNMELHRTPCRFQKSPGKVYHLYQKEDGRNYLGMLGPDDWNGQPPHRHIGSYRLEADRSFTPLEEIESRDKRRAELLGALKDEGK